MNLHVRAINRSDELEKVYRLRYEVYILEMTRKQTYVDNARRIIADPLDWFGVTFV